ncbi:Hypothetical predicted protein [Cloeon dipterum]|uniref:Uncharacterized protein n=1 Tax=Cloeon dipterum TaxID=197152 RepID=A0A8S1CIQ7_9INSE|nr:Hypothetical predicted protein [Cloeon dipterum]
MEVMSKFRSSSHCAVRAAAHFVELEGVERNVFVKQKYMPSRQIVSRLFDVISITSNDLTLPFAISARLSAFGRTI